jgi:CheY-like chemotaxis protein/two-component sensor histidine kinase
MSHELRTPLNSLLILAKLLADNGDTNLTAKQVEYAKTIHSAGNDLLALINQILDLSKIEAGKLQVDARRVGLSDLCDYVQSTFTQVGAQKNLEFKLHLSPEAPRDITTDVQRLQQILKNLLSNAFKFTERGRVELSIYPVRDLRVLKRDDLRKAPAVMAFAVHDTGIGIPDDKQLIIFEAFQQADSSTSRMYGGTGLGLTISRELAHLLGGEIAVESQSGVGSTFTLYIPAGAAALAGAGRAEVESWTGDDETSVSEVPLPEQSSEELAGRRVLLIDDDVRNLFAITSVLERCRMDVICTSTAQEGIAALNADPTIDIVLMDIMLPGMDGYQATQRIRDIPAFRKLPIVALTAKTMPGDREKCLEAGCSAFVAKPVDLNRLIYAMKETLTAREAS